MCVCACNRSTLHLNRQGLDHSSSNEDSFDEGLLPPRQPSSGGAGSWIRLLLGGQGPGGEDDEGELEARGGQRARTPENAGESVSSLGAGGGGEAEGESSWGAEGDGGDGRVWEGFTERRDLVDTVVKVFASKVVLRLTCSHARSEDAAVGERGGGAGEGMASEGWGMAR